MMSDDDIPMAGIGKVASQVGNTCGVIKYKSMLKISQNSTELKTEKEKRFLS